MLTFQASVGAPFVQASAPFKFQGVDARLIVRPTSLPTVQALTNGDAEVLRYTAADAVSDYQLEVRSFGGAGFPQPTFTCLHPDLAEVDSTGLVRFKNPGVAQVRVDLQGQSRTVSLNIQNLEGVSHDELVRFTPGTAIEHATHAVESRLAGKDAAVALDYYTTQDLTTGTFVRNPQVWCNDIDLTGLMAWNHARRNHPWCFLVSPRHVLSVGHYMVPVGATVRFVDSNGAYVDRSIISRVQHPEFNGGKSSDVAIHLLNADVPETVGFIRVLGPGYQSKLPTDINLPRRLPFVYPNKFKTMHAAEIYRMHPSTPETERGVTVRPVSVPEGPAFSGLKVMFDSGSPAMIIINNTPVVLGTAFSWGGGQITWLYPAYGMINAMMTQLGGGYQLTPVDLSGFPDVGSFTLPP